MKNFIFSLIVCVLFSTASFAQDWTVGVPVDEVVIETPFIEATSFCDSLGSIDAVINIPLPAVSGVSYYFYIDTVSAETDTFRIVINDSTHLAVLGDSLQINPMVTDTCFELGQTCQLIEIGFKGPSDADTISIGAKILAKGTPTVAGENYPKGYCDAWFYQPIGCYTKYFPAEIDINGVDTCYTISHKTQVSTARKDISYGELSIYPNPATKHFFVQSNSKLIGQPYSLFNNVGERILEGELTSTTTQIDLDDLPTGIYLLKVGQDISRTFKVILE